MKNRSLFLIALIAALSSYTCISSMSYNAGIQAGYNIEISTFHHKNDGMIKALNAVTINATTMSGSGSVSAHRANIKCDNYNFNGSISCAEDCVIKAKKFDAPNGSIEGKKVTIICDEFNFRGALSCSQECTIYVKTPFDYTMFKRNGLGKFIAIVTKNNFEPHTQESLLSNAGAKLIQGCLKLTAENIENELKKTRTHAVLNRIDDIKILEQLKRNVEVKAHYCQERLNQKRGESTHFYTSAIFGGVGSMGIALATTAFLYSKSITQKLKLNDPTSAKFGAAIAGLVSLGSLLMSYTSLAEWLNPHYKEKYEKLSLAIAQIDQSLKTKRIPEEEIIILNNYSNSKFADKGIENVVLV